MGIVHLYYNVCDKAYMRSEQSEGWGLTPWGNNTSYYEGNTLEEGDFVIPDGYELSEEDGTPCIVLGREICPLWTTRGYRRGTPTIYHPDRLDGIRLERAMEGKR